MYQVTGADFSRYHQRSSILNSVLTGHTGGCISQFACTWTKPSDYIWPKVVSRNDIFHFPTEARENPARHSNSIFIQQWVWEPRMEIAKPQVLTAQIIDSLHAWEPLKVNMTSRKFQLSEKQGIFCWNVGYFIDS